MDVFTNALHLGGGVTVRAISPIERTFSGASADTVPSLPEISVSSADLASYVHQLRSYLPKASTLINGRTADGAVSERTRVESERGEMSSRSDGYTSEFMDRNVTSRWDKQKPKVIN